MKSAWVTVLTILAVCVAAVTAFAPEPLCADSWAMPETQTTYSDNGTFRFTVEPSPIDSQLDYFTQELAASEAGLEVERPSAFGQLEKLEEDGSWTMVWGMPLANMVAPVSAKVAADGRYVITFDNWHSIGHGENVIVIYDAAGEIVRTMALSDFLPKDYIAAFDRSVSSVYWQKDSAIHSDGETLILNVFTPGQDSSDERAETVRFRVTLSNGAVAEPPENQWETAKCAAKMVNNARAKGERQRLAYLRRPLTSPVGCEQRDWHQYLYEAHARLSRADDFASTTVLFPLDHPRHEESVSWLRDHISDAWGGARHEAFTAACDPKALVSAVRRIAADVQPSAWSNATFYIAAPAAEFGRIKRLLSSTGARLVWLDPESRIPQRPDRVP